MDNPLAVVIEIPWPRYPLLTPKGRVSKSKKAGRRVPWLNANQVNNMHRQHHAQVKILWREAARDAAIDDLSPWVVRRYPVRVHVQLFPAQRRRRDVSGIIEGVKPIIDGLVEASWLWGDDENHIEGFKVLPAVLVGRSGNAGVRIALEWDGQPAPAWQPPVQELTLDIPTYARVLQHDWPEAAARIATGGTARGAVLEVRP